MITTYTDCPAVPRSRRDVVFDYFSNDTATRLARQGVTVIGAYTATVLTLMGIWSIVALALTVITGYAGQFNLGIGVYMGTGRLCGCHAQHALRFRFLAGIALCRGRSRVDGFSYRTAGASCAGGIRLRSSRLAWSSFSNPYLFICLISAARSESANSAPGDWKHRRWARRISDNRFGDAPTHYAEYVLSKAHMDGTSLGRHS